VEVTLIFRVMNVDGASYVAATNVGGVVVRSGVSPSPVEAVRQVLAHLLNSNGDASIGLALALAGGTVDDLTKPELEKGEI
jgi:hypothetical protein